MEVKQTTFLDMVEDLRAKTLNAVQGAVAHIQEAYGELPEARDASIGRGPSPSPKSLGESAYVHPFDRTNTHFTLPVLAGVEPWVTKFSAYSVDVRYTEYGALMNLGLPWFMTHEPELWELLTPLVGPGTIAENPIVQAIEDLAEGKLTRLTPEVLPQLSVAIESWAQQTPELHYPGLGSAPTTISVRPGYRSDPFVPIQWDTPLWHIREFLRLGAVYEKLPPEVYAALDPDKIKGAYPHMPVKEGNAGLIAYTENPAKGQMDRQSVMKAGRFIRRYGYDHLSDEDVKQLAASVLAAGTLTFHHTREESEYARIYMEGPSSCMAYGPEDKHFGRLYVDGEFFHPAQAYAHPDNNIELVWLEAPDGTPAARAVVNRRTMKYPRVYGSDKLKNSRVKLERYLETQGFSHSEHALDGEMLLLVSPDDYPDAIICPYIDSNNRGVVIRDDHLEVGGPEQADHETGCLYNYNTKRETWSCNCCDETFDEDDEFCIDVDENRVCSGCIDNRYRSVLDLSSLCTEYVHDEDSHCLYTPVGDMPQGHALRHYIGEAVYIPRNALMEYHGLVYLDEDFHYEDYPPVAHRDACVTTKWNTHVLVEDLEDNDLFVHPGDGLAYPTGDWIALVDPETNEAKLVDPREVDMDELTELDLSLKQWPVDHYIPTSAN